MKIRAANIDQDALAIFEGAKDCINRQGRQGLLPTDPQLLQTALGRVLSNPGVDVFVVENNGEIIAGLGIWITPYFWNPSILVAEELFWWAKRGAPANAALELFNTVLCYCVVQNAVPCFKAPKDQEAIAKHFERAGLRPAEIVYIGEKSWH